MRAVVFRGRRCSMRVGLCAALIAAPLAFAVDPLRHAVESRMLLHMLVQFPLLLAAGAAARLLLRHVAPRTMAGIDAVDWHGLSGLTLLSLVSALWMVPAALDEALLDPAVGLLKYASWWLSGLVVAGSWRRLGGPLQLFLLGNLAWMFATAGMLFAATPARLCVSYLQNEQEWTGRALVVLALGLGGLLIARAVHPDPNPILPALNPRAAAPAAASVRLKRQPRYQLLGDDDSRPLSQP